MSVILNTLASMVLAYTAHYGIVKLYNIACVPDGLWGYLHGMISTGSPVCKGALQVISQTEVSYSSMVMMGITRAIVDLVAPIAVKE